MKIGIDARLIGETGVGRYIRNLILYLSQLDKENTYIVFLRKSHFSSFILPNKNWEKRLADVPWHSVIEQIVMPWLLIKEHLDLVHIPYFNVPIFYPGKFVVTIHDLTILHFNTGKATTLPRLLYKLRRLGYFVALSVGLIRASHLIAVSQNTKKEIADHFQIPSQKISVTYEGVDRNFYSQPKQSLPKEKNIPSAYFLYVGNVYPHKNAEILITVFQNFHQRLVFVGKNDYFYQQIKNQVQQYGIGDRILFFGEASEKELITLYKEAIALIIPSRMEGFGLPGLEAMSVGTPVVASDIPAFREIYGSAALYFYPDNEENIAKALQKISTDENIRTSFIQKGKQQVKKYSWQQMAKETLTIYKR